ncbi:similar to Saccharomyces cerevisiae YBR170C NPL4 Ubiquitin-binding protein involved in protein degradation [Maudiozyma barnettii]|uniref:Nuclear protein localization protein 4 n=1 Tax=Maudiozyma barnettii TaxID=61262 RepID=A0A8H2VDV6_9SACH|nr:nuclear protein localization protein 4 [Kazachstania barnettii]CAB4253660.1 similar to Saccharomyces cerevisiae YBR170C NPL4 Ubiquitin-binding protein involved in protein degradation [Kazachstania barnettii]CAD1781354.1 similar to Saccharomyces cerevisiae YBR170C NPL4 Ubiquitin-binding protein involved in protein degradation [Kazachstania barnettii]
MLVRFRSKDGMHRVSCEESNLFGALLENLLTQLKEPIDVSSIKVSDKPGLNNGEPVGNIIERTVRDLGLHHGDIVYITYDKNSTDINETAAAVATTHISQQHDSNSQSVNIDSLKTNTNNSSELPIDMELEKENGSISRKRSPLCKHGDKGMCEYCSPLPPWDKSYHEEHNIKHISFHSYLKRINEATNKKENGSSYIAPLSEPNFKIDLHCTNGHESWPRGICSKCQPSAITLQQQEFRMVDHVEFQNSALINNFIEAWRSTGMQRFAYMYGTYKKYDSTPLGIKAVVEAIYEPPQHDEQDGLTMDGEQVLKEMKEIDDLASKMRLFRIGLMFTDLTDSGNGDGSVFCKRHKDSFFLSSFEVIMAAKHQLEHPNICKFSEQNTFSSKFVTCVISGNLEGNIDISSYQVSTDAEALIDATMISGSTHPSMAYINETTNKRYVPEIFYMKKNEYNLTVKENAKPAFPNDYLLVSLSHGFPTTESTEDTKQESTEDKEVGETATIPSKPPMFISKGGFPWANRQAMGQSQDYQELKKYIFQSATSDNFNELHEKISNFHFLIYIHSLQIINEEQWKLLVQAATTTAPGEDYETPLLQLITTPEWQTLIMILQESS